MRLNKFKGSAVVLLALAAMPAGAATSRSNQSVGQVQMDARPCLFFYLKNVGEADPAVPSQVWFTIPTTSANYQTAASVVLSSKLSGQPLLVQTDGTVSCGYATASVVGFN